MVKMKVGRKVTPTLGGVYWLCGRARGGRPGRVAALTGDVRGEAKRHVGVEDAVKHPRSFRLGTRPEHSSFRRRVVSQLRLAGSQEPFFVPAGDRTADLRLPRRARVPLGPAHARPHDDRPVNVVAGVVRLPSSRPGHPAGGAGVSQHGVHGPGTSHREAGDEHHRRDHLPPTRGRPVVVVRRPVRRLHRPSTASRRFDPRRAEARAEDDVYI